MTEYFKVLGDLADYITFFAEKMGTYEYFEAKNQEELKQIVQGFSFEIEKAKIALKVFKEIEPPENVKVNNAELIALLEKYFFHTSNAVKCLSNGDLGCVREELILQDETAKKIVALSKVF